MYIAPTELCLRDGRKVILRSPAAADAAADIRCMLTVFSETDFLLGSPEDVCQDAGLHAGKLVSAAEDPHTCLLLCIGDGEVLARMHAYIKPAAKVRHRLRLGVAVRKAYWGQGIASAMMEAAEAFARTRHATQAELEVMAHNRRACALYERLGYHIVQVRPDAILLPDGTFSDEYLMIKKL